MDYKLTRLIVLNTGAGGYKGTARRLLSTRTGELQCRGNTDLLNTGGGGGTWVVLGDYRAGVILIY